MNSSGQRDSMDATADEYAAKKAVERLFVELSGLWRRWSVDLTQLTEKVICLAYHICRR